MKTKNLIFLTLLISVLMVSVVSAGITGYLVSRGGGIADAGYRATLQKVEGTTAVISVQTPSGTTEVVRVAEGKTAQVGNAEISASSLTRGTLFRRAGADVKLDIGPAPEPIKVPGAKFLPGNWTGLECSVYGGQAINNSQNGYDFCTGKGYGDYCLIHRWIIEDAYTNLSTGHKGPLFNGCGGAQNLLYTDSQYAPLTCDNAPLNYDWGCQDKNHKSLQDQVVCCKF